MGDNEREEIKKVKELMDNDYYEKAIAALNDIDDNHYSKKFFEVKYLFLGISYFYTEGYNKAIYYAEQALQLNSKNEFASHTKYLSYIQTGDFNNAFLEILGFLKDNPANLYKVSLSELLEDIAAGYIYDEDLIAVIKGLAIENGVM